MNAPKRLQLTADELRQFRWLLGGLMILLGAWTVIYMDVAAWSLMALTTVVAIAMLARPTLPARVPRLVHTLAFPAIVAFFAGDLWLRSEVLPAMVRLDMLLLLYRSICYRQKRDDLQIIVLGLFLIVVAGVLTVSLLFAAQLLLFTAGALAFLFVVTLSENAAAPTPRFEPGAPPPAWAMHVHWGALLGHLRRAADWRVLGFGVALFAGVVAVSALLFMAIPRFQLQNSMFLERFITKGSRSGFSETVRFGDVTDIQQDNAIALSVDVSNPQRIPATPYWRMLVLDTYENGTFRMSAPLREGMMAERATYALPGNAAPGARTGEQWTFYLESGISRYLPLLGRFGRLEFMEAQNFRYDQQLNLLALRGEPVSMIAYRVTGFELAPALLDPTFWRSVGNVARSSASNVATFRRLSLDAESEAMLAAARREIVADGEKIGAGEFTRRANEWLRRKHTYTLSPRIPAGSADPLVRWLALGEAGHCELFAGSFVLLARQAGFYARVVTGFKGGSWNAFSNNFTIRNSDAHAWAEIFDEASGSWLRSDPLGVSAGQQADQEARGEQALAALSDRSWKARIDSLRVFWYRRIVSFDQQSQLETLKSVKAATESTGKRVREAIEAALGAVRQWLSAPWDATRFGVLAVTGAAAGYLVWWWRRFGRSCWRTLLRPRGAAGEDPVRREAGVWLARLGAGAGGGATAEPVWRDLQRLRFGARATWGEPGTIFAEARRARRAQQRQPRATPT